MTKYQKIYIVTCMIIDIWITIFGLVMAIKALIDNEWYFATVIILLLNLTIYAPMYFFNRILDSIEDE